MTIEQRLSNLEKLVNALSKKIDDNKFYQQADIDGTRQSVTNITPYTETKTAYYGETEKVFYDVPQGNTFIYTSIQSLSWNRQGDRIYVYFTPLTEQTDITISIS